MVSVEPFWLVEVERALSVVIGTDVPSPWGQPPVVWGIIITIVVIVRASRLGRAVTDLLTALNELTQLR